MKNKFRIPMFTDKGTFTEFQYIELGELIECTLCGYNGEPEQCTGLKDKNGKLIYEGDIVEVNTGSKVDSGYGVIEYHQAGCNFIVCGYLKHPSKFQARKKGEFCKHLREWLCIEVIGNIHQNKELLELLEK